MVAVSNSQSSDPSSQRSAGDGHTAAPWSNTLEIPAALDASTSAAVSAMFWYAWLVVIAIFDAMCTSIILHPGGYEANPLAAAVIHRGGILGMVIYRVAIVVTILILVLCEWLWKGSPAHVRMAILTSLIISVSPEAIGLAQFAVHRFP